MPDLSYLILPLFLASGALSYANIRWPHPLAALANRWLRWIAFSLAAGYLLNHFELFQRPVWLLALTAFVLWFCLETAYNWIFIGMLSRSQVPLFPRYEASSGKEEWPNQRRFIRLRDRLRKEGFALRQSLRAPLMDNLALRTSVFEAPERTVWVQVHLIPQRVGNFVLCYILHSRTASGARVITDNVFVPAGCFYPTNWTVTRRPLCRSLERLLRVHERRVRALEEPLEPFSEDLEPVDELNSLQRELEKTNYEAGFLLPVHLHEEYGRLSQEGRYRFWKELWLINYFGISPKR